MEFKDIIGEKEIPEIDLIIEKTKLVPKTVNLIEKTKIDDNVYYGDIKLGTPKKIKEMVDVGFKVLKEFKKTKNELKKSVTLLEEAKDEIERLRNIVDNYHNEYNNL